MPQQQIGVSAGKQINILSIDGGGIRGILPSRILAEIEKRTNRKTVELFDLIAGTSTGGIIACGVAVGMTASEIGDIYSKRGGEIFARSLWQRVSNPAQLDGPKYGAKTLESILSTILGERMLSSVNGAELLVPTYAIDLGKPQTADGVTSTRTPMFFKTWKARGLQLDPDEKPKDFDFHLADVARATSAAPTYFPPAYVRNASGDSFGAVDGGVFANNPALCALVAAYRLYPCATYNLVSLGTGSLERTIPYGDAKSWGDLQWLHPILSVLMDGNADTVCYQCDQVLGTKHIRFEVTLGTDPNNPITVNEDFDDAGPDNIGRLERLAQATVVARNEQLEAVCSKLTSIE